MIRRQEIVGARITGIYAKSTFEQGYNCSSIYFAVDRGFVFELPWPGHEWERSAIPEDAEELKDEYREDSFTVKYTWFRKKPRLLRGPSKKIDIVKKIKERTISGIVCHKTDGDMCYAPDAALLLFDDGSLAYSRSVAPQGISVGLYYLTKDEVQDSQELVDVFDIPVTKWEMSDLSGAGDDDELPSSS